MSESSSLACTSGGGANRVTPVTVVVCLPMCSALANTVRSGVYRIVADYDAGCLGCKAMRLVRAERPNLDDAAEAKRKPRHNIAHPSSHHGSITFFAVSFLDDPPRLPDSD